jgi:SAM-dependent methyltransferase
VPDMATNDMGPVLKDRTQFLSVMSELCNGIADRENLSLLVLGGSGDDIRGLSSLGFRNTTLSNLAASPDLSAIGQPGNCVPRVAVDAEDMAIPDNSYDIVFAHEVLHHCRSPHRALCEMLRVSRRYIIFMEPNDSLAMRLLVRTRFSLPYELPAVIDNGGKSGGVRDSAIPNFIYRWNKNELFKIIASFLAEYLFSLRTYPYWDFNVDEKELALRNQTKISIITNAVGARNFLITLKWGQRLLNLVPFLRSQGNKFLCLVEKHTELKPWLSFNDDQIVFNLETNASIVN